MQSNPQPAPLAALTLADLRAVSGGATTADAASVTASVLSPDPPSKPPPK